MKKRIIGGVLVALVLAAGVYGQTKPDAAVFVRSFYKFHWARSNIFTAGNLRAYRKWFSPALNKLFDYELKREAAYLKLHPTDKPYFGDGFPFQPLDECYVNKRSYNNTYKTGAVTADGDRTLVEIVFASPKICGGAAIDTYKVALVNGKAGWLIDDWIYPDGRRLTEDLKRPEY
ncbi:MAG: hypothetical protein JSS81_12890 [Acidobacteria bacterium]|nr:hypothetical protein [Acidobacteriota bacterium]